MYFTATNIEVLYILLVLYSDRKDNPRLGSAVNLKRGILPYVFSAREWSKWCFAIKILYYTYDLLVIFVTLNDVRGDRVSRHVRGSRRHVRDRGICRDFQHARVHLAGGHTAQFCGGLEIRRAHLNGLAIFLFFILRETK